MMVTALLLEFELACNSGIKVYADNMAQISPGKTDQVDGNFISQVVRHSIASAHREAGDKCVTLLPGYF